MTFLPLRLHAQGQVAGRLELGVDFEGLFGTGDLEAIDGRDHVSVLHPDLGEWPVGLDRVEPEAGRLAVAHFGHDARRAREQRHVTQH